ncbi:hypothetical protein HanIR_Chr13g0659331 [Helianthus annuus]|nr:hypothetical protein HanIR_Chr13g0659331 [Helianthus annuus]
MSSESSCFKGNSPHVFEKQGNKILLRQDIDGNPSPEFMANESSSKCRRIDSRSAKSESNPLFAIMFL